MVTHETETGSSPLLLSALLVTRFLSQTVAVIFRILIDQFYEPRKARNTRKALLCFPVTFTSLHP